MIENIVIMLIRQASTLTKPQQDEFITKAAEALAALIRGTETKIDDELVRQIALPIGAQLINALSERV